MVLRVLLAMALAVVLVACGGNGDEDGPVIRTPTSPSDATETPAAETATPGSPDTPTPGETGEPNGDATPESPTQGAQPGGSNDVVVLPCNEILAPVDKQHRLPADCVPDHLVALPEPYSYGGQQLLIAEAAEEFQQMVNTAANVGIYIFARSSYRSYDTQVSTFEYWVSVRGEEEASRISARPGHSEHQLGTTTDVTAASVGYELSQAFGNTEEGRWVEENAWRFGFIISYPEGKEHITGYVYEPWHIRYVGRDVAQRVHESGLTLGEYLHSIWW